MTQEALKLALEALEEAWYHVGTFQPTEKAIDLYDEARTAIKEALAQTQEPWCMKMNGCKTKCEDCPDEPPQRTEQEPVACAECERLKDALKRANGLAEHFERAWYLRGDEIELLKAQTQEPVAWLQIGLAPLHDGDVIARTSKPTKWNSEWWRFEPLYTTPPQRTEQEPFGFAGVKMWIGNQQVVRVLTQTELHHAIDPWLLVKLNAEMCIEALKGDA